MDVLIADSNIWIDLEEGGLLCHLFALPTEIITPDVLFEQELSEQHGHLLRMGLVKESVPGVVMGRISTWQSNFPKTSRLDLVALGLAQEKSGILVTGDSALREAADELGVCRHGTLWLMDEFIERDLLTAETAREAYQHMYEADRRLPWSIVNDQLQQWGVAEIECE